ncbi:hypothetical protein C4577_07570 [Candidatus Parcubacteria bacterium]|nr:MAG: hypothetical protein C4577_07570 [Candidatus Parcubacteria bacterium]
MSALPGLINSFFGISANNKNDSTAGNIATVIVGTPDLNADGAVNTILPEDEEDPFAMWTDFTVMNYYEYDLHRYMAGMTSPDPFDGATAAFFQLAAPTMLWMSRWTCCRLSIAPDIPTPISFEDEDWVTMDEQYETASIVTLKDATTPLYRISGLYVFGHRNPSKQLNILNLMNFGRPPWITTEIGRNVGQECQQVSNVIDSSNVQTAMPGTPIQ